MLSDSYLSLLGLNSQSPTPLTTVPKQFRERSEVMLGVRAGQLDAVLSDVNGVTEQDKRCKSKARCIFVIRPTKGAIASSAPFVICINL